MYDDVYSVHITAVLDMSLCCELRDGLKAVLSRQRQRSRRGKAAMSLTEVRQGRGSGRELKMRQTKFEARPRRGDPLKNPTSPRYIAVPNLVALSQTV